MKDKNIGKLLSIIHRNLSMFMDHSIPAEGIGHGQKRLLIEIALHPGRTQEEVAECFLKDKTTIARAVKGLEKMVISQRDKTPRTCESIFCSQQKKALPSCPSPYKQETRP